MDPMPAAPAAADPWAWRPPLPSRLEKPVTLLRIEGPDSRRFLHGQTSQDLQLAPPGAWRRTCCLTATARLRGLAEVLIDGDGAWLAITCGDAAAVRQALDRVLFPADDVRLGPPLPGRWLESTETAPAAAGGSWQPLPEGAGWRLEGGAVLLPDEAPLPADLATLPPLAATEAERWRIRRGEPSAPAELNEDHNPFELGLAARVSLSKGCFLGQETLAKLATYDGVKQQLRRWHLAPVSGVAAGEGGAGGAEPRPGAELRDRAGQRAGTVTSVLALPEGGWIGLALVRRAALAEERLRVGEAATPGGSEAPWLAISVPDELVPPPVGAGGAQAGGSGGSPAGG